MATHIEEASANKPGRRARLTLDIDRALHTRIRLAAFREGISMREYIERILDDGVPRIETGRQRTRRPISPEVVARLREAQRHEPVRPDSTELIREMRAERSEYLGQL